MQSSFTLELDGESILADGEAVGTSLADFLHRRGFGRDARFRRPDPWLGGAPLLILDMDGRGRPALRSIDAALMLLPAAAGRRFWSAEGVALQAERGEIHPAFAALAARPETECTWSGRARLLTALIEGYYRTDLASPGHLAEQFDGCLSRTFDHGAIRELASELFSSARAKREEAAREAREQGREADFLHGRVDVHGDAFSALLAGEAPEPEEFSYVDREKRRFHRPQTIADLAKLLAQFPGAVVAGGGSGLILEGKNRIKESACLVATEGVGDLRAIHDREHTWDIGAAAPITSVAERLGDIYPSLAKITRRCGTRPARNRATLGGALGAANPESELAPALMALDAKVRVLSLDGERSIPASSFFEGPGKTNLRPSEIVADVILPQFTESALEARGCRARLCDAYKAAPRRESSPGGVTGSFAVELDAQAMVNRAWIAYSGVAGLPLRARAAEDALKGLPWTEDSIFSVLPLLSREIQSAPGADSPAPRLLPGELEYRRQLVVTLVQKFYYQHPRADSLPVELGAVSEFLSSANPSPPFSGTE